MYTKQSYFVRITTIEDINIMVENETSNNILPGIYRHFKGGRYEVIGIASHSENPEEKFVVYKNLSTGLFWVRPAQMFIETINREGYKGPRFVREE